MCALLEMQELQVCHVAQCLITQVKAFDPQRPKVRQLLQHQRLTSIGTTFILSHDL